MRRRLGIAAVVVAAVLSPASVAAASSRQESVFEDDDLLLYSPADAVDSTMAELRTLGVDRVRLPALWRDLAPDSRPRDATDPAAYPADRIAKLDRAINSASAHGLSVLLNIRGGAPAWARGAHAPRKIADRDAYKPDAKAFGGFVQMLGRRYSGTYVDTDTGPELLPRVNAWSLWNEPNWGGLLQPQSERDPRTKRMHTYAPRLYRELYYAGQAGLRASGHAADVILIGETAPLGDKSVGLTHPIYAARFYRDLFCLDARLKPLKGLAARLDGCGDFAKKGALATKGVAHHPYPVLAAPEFKSILPDEIRLADGRRLVRILDAARRYKRVTGKIPIWYTEFGYQTNPPDPYRGVTPQRQAAWTVRAERLAFSDPRVLAFDQFLLRDTGPQTQYPVSDRRYWSTYQTGLRYASGEKKPVYDAYRLPLLALDRIRNGRPLRLWGMVRPGADGVRQSIRIEHRASAKAAWAAIQTLEVRNAKGYFTVHLAHAIPGQYRFVWLGQDGDVGSAPATRR